MQAQIDEHLIQRRLQENEGQYLELKSAYDRSGDRVRRRQARLVARDVAEALCAFANTDGGTLLVGVEDDRTVSGVPYPQDRLEVLTRAPETHCRPPVRAQWALVPYAGVQVLVFVVDSSLEAHSLTDGRTPLRVGDTTISLPQEDIAALKRARARTIFERQAVPGATLDDLDTDLVQEYATRVSEDDPLVALETLDLAQRFDGQVRVSMGALLLFGQPPLLR
jgi:ATP-dependent DNA helicase RecG